VRVDLIPTYESFRAEPAARTSTPMTSIAPQMPVRFELLEGCWIPVARSPRVRGAGRPGTLAERAPGRVDIVSGDRDLIPARARSECPLVASRRGVGQVDEVNESYIEDRYGIPRRAYRDFAVLRGDPSAGLSGVLGIGEILATSLVTRYGNPRRFLGAAASTDEGVIGRAAVIRPSGVGQARHHAEYAQAPSLDK
jgi:5'-3' exonuclease